MSKNKNYRLSVEIDPELRYQFSLKTKKERTNMKDKITELIKDYVKLSIILLCLFWGISCYADDTYNAVEGTGATFITNTTTGETITITHS